MQEVLGTGGVVYRKCRCTGDACILAVASIGTQGHKGPRSLMPSL